MAVIRFNCVVNGKRTSTSISEDLVRHFATALQMFNNQSYPDYHIQLRSGGYLHGFGEAKKITQEFINGLSLKSTDEIEFKMLQRILYTTPKKLSI